MSHPDRMAEVARLRNRADRHRRIASMFSQAEDILGALDEARRIEAEANRIEADHRPVMRLHIV